MTLEELRTRSDLLERELARHINDFASATGIFPAVEVEGMDITGLTDERKRMRAIVTVRIILE